MAKDFLTNNPRKEYLGNEKKLRPGMLVDYFVQHHLAKKRGPHYDFRIGTKNTGLFSWAGENHPLKTHEGDKSAITRTNLHSHSYGKWEGMIPPGYGHGEVKLDSSGKALITNVTPKTISFTIPDKDNQQRYTLINPGKGYDKNFWLLLHKKNTDQPADNTKTAAIQYLHKLIGDKSFL